MLLAGLLALTACEDDTRTPFVLVHGAWMGASAWDEVAAELRAAGAEVITFDLPAHGADRTPPADASLDAYVARVEQALDGEEVVLVGHSMAGVVISQVAERAPDRIAELVYLAAYLPSDGDSLADLAGHDADSLAGANLVFHADGTVGLPRDRLAEIFCADCDDGGRAALDAGYRDEPGAPFAEPVSLGDRFGRVRKTYIHTRQDRAVSPALQEEMSAAVDRALTLDTSHAPMLAAPAELAAALLSIEKGIP